MIKTSKIAPLPLPLTNGDGCDTKEVATSEKKIFPVDRVSGASMRPDVAPIGGVFLLVNAVDKLLETMTDAERITINIRALRRYTRLKIPYEEALQLALEPIKKRITKKEMQEKAYNSATIERIRADLYLAVKKGNTQSPIMLTYLGCSIKELRQHIESQWQEGMNWDNWSHSGWHIDHIIPLKGKGIKLRNKRHLAMVCHYSNLRPLWAKQNFKKKNKMPQGLILPT
jgi:hypothetical protein